MSCVDSQSEMSSMRITVVHPTDLTQACYKNVHSFRETMHRHLNNAFGVEGNELNWTRDRNQQEIIVFPELIGAWLVALNEKPFVFWIPSRLLAFIFIALSNMVSFVRFFIAEIWIYFSVMKRLSNVLNFEVWEGIVERSVFKLKSHVMFDVYVSIFSEIARKRKAYVVAGSIYLPKIVFNERWKRVTSEGLYNQSIVFDPRGNICHISIKQHPSEEEDMIVTNSKHEEANTFHIEGFGKVAVLICNDSWYPSCYPETTQDVPSLIVIPSFSAPSTLWNNSWQGHQLNFPLPLDSDELNGHVNKTSLSQMWKEDGSGNRIYKLINWTMQDPTHTHVVSCQASGKIWEISFMGDSFIRNCDGVLLEKEGSFSYLIEQT